MTIEEIFSVFLLEQSAACNQCSQAAETTSICLAGLNDFVVLIEMRVWSVPVIRYHLVSVKAEPRYYVPGKYDQNV